MINQNKNQSKLKWESQQLNDDDMELIGYYLLENNKVNLI